MEYKRIVILAKSHKPGGWCVAGKEIQYQDGVIQYVGGWIRPVSGDEEHHGSLTNTQCRIDGDGFANIYDIVDVPLSRHVPEPGQPENYRLEDGVAWRKIDYVAPGNIRQLEDKPDDIWLEDGISTDRVSSEYDESGSITHSLYLLKPEEFSITLSNDFNPFTGRSKKDTRASFKYRDVQYEHISITDPHVRMALADKYPAEDSPHVVEQLVVGDNCLICMSLSPRFAQRQEHYKLVATVLDFTGYYQRNFR